MPAIVRCGACGFTNVCRDAFAKQGPETGDWELLNLFDQFVCDDCGEETEHPDEQTTPA